MLAGDLYGKNLRLVGFVVDEAHCVKKISSQCCANYAKSLSYLTYWYLHVYNFMQG